MRWLVFMAALLVACGSGTLRVDAPPLDQARSLVIAVHERGTVTLHAIAVVDELPAVSFDVRSLGEYDVFALVYAETLGDLGLEPGPLALVTDEPQKPLDPAMNEFAVAKDADGRPEGWGIATERPTWLRELRVRGAPNPCRGFDSKSLKVLPSPSSRHDWGFAARRGDVVIAGTDLGEFYEIRADTSVRTLSGPAQALQATAGVADAVGGVWVSDIFGRLWHGDLGDEPSLWTIASALTPVQQADFMDVADDGSQVVVMARDGAVASYTGGTWRVVHTVQTERDSTARKGGVVWLGPDDFLAVGPFSRTVTRVTNGRVTEEPTPAMSGLTAIHRLPSVGIVAGSGSGEILLRRSGRWEALASSGSTFWVLGMSEYGDGLVFGAPYGGFGQYSSLDHACPLASPVAFTIRYVVALGSQLLLLGESLGDPAPRGVVLTPR